ncbi:hypothetical protein O6H91_07G047200 [Diphasiastrum complanatum]|uniref:Uncharacterized protein n=1 Tax=Diphasiastrum complanatum TaxID=34168 RepID=A0ACC2D4S9_DIPCM|nr:hypothetical protein O6H91_07G047200 [Diphasiastrum complanatum]
MDQGQLVINTSKTREDWVNRKVFLWSFDHTQVVVEGYILLAYPHEAIDYKELGNDHVGITISKIYGNLIYQNDNVAHEVNAVENIHIQLLKWPITQVTLEDGSKLIDHQQEDDIIFYLTRTRYVINYEN